METWPNPLLKRAVNALTSLRTLSEVPARRYDANQSNHTAESTILVSFTADGDLQPKEPSLFAYHRERINTSRTLDELELRVLAAEGAIEATKRRVHVEQDRMDPEDMRKHVRHLHYQCGMTPAEIAYFEDLPMRWVKAVVRRNDEL